MSLEGLLRAPSIFWWINESNVDRALDLVAYVGAALSAILVILGSGNVLMLLVLRILYHSLVSSGQTWYSFGEFSLAAILLMGFVIAIPGENMKLV